MKLNIPVKETKHATLWKTMLQWNSWFAWYPVRTSKETVHWLEVVVRKKADPERYEYSHLSTSGQKIKFLKSKKWLYKDKKIYLAEAIKNS